MGLVLEVDWRIEYADGRVTYYGHEDLAPVYWEGIDEKTDNSDNLDNKENRMEENGSNFLHGWQCRCGSVRGTNLNCHECHEFSERIPSWRIKNRTPHPVNIVDENGVSFEIPPDERTARVFQNTVQIASIGNFGLFQSSFGEVRDLPEPEEGVLIVVSLHVARNAPKRGDLVIPGPLNRDSTGKVISARGFHVLGETEDV